VLEQALQAARDQREKSQADLFELIRMPSISALSEHAADCRHAAEWVAARLQAAGMKVELADVAGDGQRHPVIAAEWMGAGPDAPTLAIYGHYDVQPPDPLDEWASPPFEPSVREGFVYARGSDDNKGQFMCGIRAAELALARAGMTVFWPSPWKPPRMPCTSSVGRAQRRSSGENSASPSSARTPSACFSSSSVTGSRRQSSSSRCSGGTTAS